MAYKYSLGSHNSQINNGLSELLIRVFFFLGMLGFVISLFLPTFFTSDEDVIGSWIFILGWMGIVVFQFAWYANPINVLALMISDAQPRLSILLSMLALVIASEAFFFYEIPTGLPTELHQEKLYIKEFGIGFYCWYLSQVFFLLALISKYLVKRAVDNCPY